MAAEAFAALNRILESRERREQSNRQLSLALMQFDYQKRQAEIAQTGKNLELLQGANAQMMTTVASDFINQSGLGAIYSAEDDGPKKAKEAIKKLGLSERDQDRVVSAVWSYYSNQDPRGVLNLAKDIKALSMSQSTTSEQRRFVKGLGKGLGLTSKSAEDQLRAKDLLDKSDRVLKNQTDIMSEIYEYGTGDYDIQRTDIGLGTVDVVDDDKLLDVDEDITPAINIPTPQELVSTSKQTIKTRESEVQDAQNALSILETESFTLKDLQRRGAITDKQREYLKRVPEMKQSLENELQELNEAIKDAKSELQQSREIERSTFKERTGISRPGFL